MLNDGELWRVTQADCLPWLRALPPSSVDLVFGSPPYEAQRTYGIDFKLKGQDWVDWMVEVFKAASLASRGLVAFVVEGFTKNYKWSASPALLMADLHRAGLNLRKPPAFHRIGIPGSGGPDWFRNDYEFVVCVTAPGKLAWSDATACGHKPKYGPGGPYSYRTLDGERVNVTRHKTKGTSGYKNGDTITHAPGTLDRKITAIANPGNVIKCRNGCGHLGSDFAHQNEAPFSEAIVEPFVRSFAPPNGIVADCFSGSGTTAKVALKWGRRFIGCDIRQSQVDLTTKRIKAECVDLFAATA